MNLQIKLEPNHKMVVENTICNYLDPKNVYIPILKKEDLRKQDYIYKNSYFGAYIASVSGVIKGSKKVLIKNKYYPALKVVNDYKEDCKNDKNIKKIVNINDLEHVLEDNYFFEIVNKIKNKNVKNIIVNAVDEDPYTLNEIMILTNFYQQIFDTIEELLKIFNIENALITSKNTNSEAIKKVKSIIGTYPNINFKLLEDKYLITYDKFLCENLNIKEDETLILTASDIYDIYYFLLKHKKINETIITISGDAIEKSMIIKTRLGVSLKELINNLITINNESYEIYINGLLKGYKISNINDIIITKDIKYIVIKVKENIDVLECINCSVCYKVCPFNINVLKCYKNNTKNKRCIGCALCNYVCPSKIKLKEVVYGDEYENKNN